MVQIQINRFTTTLMELIYYGSEVTGLLLQGLARIFSAVIISIV
jgi:hypothetical protein